MLQPILGHPQADAGGHEDQVEETVQVWQYLRGGGDQSAAKLQLRLV